MVVMISASDFLFCIGHLMGDQPAGPTCSFQAFVIAYFEIVSLFWTVAIARVLQRVFLLGETDIELSGTLLRG